jgi:hypothetical protein
MSQSLCGLSQEDLKALQIFDVDAGPEQRADAGCRKHVRMIRLSWSASKVKDEIKALRDRDVRNKAKAAFQYLKRAEDSPYKYYLDLRIKLMAKHAGEPTDQQCLRPLRIIEDVGVEGAVWPHLYWRTEMCETYERSTDCRRLEGKQAREKKFGEDSSEEDPDEKEEQGVRRSMKRSFLSKVMSPLPGYGSTFELVQFVYDLNLWTALGSKKNSNLGVPLRVLMKGHSFSPLCWKSVHSALVDLVREIGFPSLYVTIAPCECSFPYREAIQDEMAKLLRARPHLPVLETLRVARVLAQVMCGLLTGQNQQTQRKDRKTQDRCWQKRSLSCKDGSGRRTVLNFFARL